MRKKIELVKNKYNTIICFLIISYKIPFFELLEHLLSYLNTQMDNDGENKDMSSYFINFCLPNDLHVLIIILKQLHPLHFAIVLFNTLSRISFLNFYL